jgi:hypothetical protein
VDAMRTPSPSATQPTSSSIGPGLAR